MKNTTCAACGQRIVIPDDATYGQHVICPFCNSKFSYLVDSPASADQTAVRRPVIVSVAVIAGSLAVMSVAVALCLFRSSSAEPAPVPSSRPMMTSALAVQPLDAAQQKTFAALVTNAMSELCARENLVRQSMAEIKESSRLLAEEIARATEVAQSLRTLRAATLPPKDAEIPVGNVRPVEPKPVAEKRDGAVERPPVVREEKVPVEKAVRLEAEKASVAEPRAKGRRQRCKSPVKCTNFAEPKHNFCSVHECHSYGCREHVRIVISANWAHGGLKTMTSLSTAERNMIKRKCIGQYCKKHCCNRVCPEIKGYNEWWNGYLYWDNPQTEKFFYCDQERLADSRYCKDHACKVPTCSSFREEYWKLDDGTQPQEKAAEINVDLWWYHWNRKWLLVIAPMCRAHCNVDPETVNPRDMCTPGDLIQAKGK